MNLDHCQSKLPSKMGTVSSFLLFVMIVAYTYYKCDIMLAKKDVDIISAVKQNYFNTDYKFSSKQGLNIAIAAFNPFDPSDYRHLDRSYGYIRFKKYNWGLNAAGEFFDKTSDIATHECTEEEMGVLGSGS